RLFQICEFNHSGCRRDLRIAIFSARPACASARPGRFLIRIRFRCGCRFVGANCGRKDVKGDALLGFGLGLALIVADPAIATLLPVLALIALIPITATALCLAALRAFACLSLGLSFDHLGAFVLVAVAILVAARALVLETGPALAEHSEIMIRVLQIIFRLHAVPAGRRLAGEAFVFREQLSGIAALPVVLAIAPASAGHSLWALPTAATTTAALTIIDQAVVPYRTGAIPKRRKTFRFKGPLSPRPGRRRQGAGCPCPVLCTDVLVHGPMASGVAAEALCDCRKRLRACAMMECLFRDI